MFLVSSLYRDVSFSHHLFQVCIFFIFLFFFLTRLVKIHGFSKCLLFCTEKSHGLYGEKRKLRPYIETKLQFLHGLYGGKRFSKIFCAILTKSMEFLSSLVFHTVLWTTVFHPILLFLLNKALLVIVWNNLDSNSVEY